MNHLPVGTKVGVIGAGTMGVGIAQILLMSGYQVLLYDQQTDLSGAAIISIRKRLERLVEKAVITQDDCDKSLLSLQAVSGLDELSDTSMIVEAIIENLEIKQQLFKTLESITAVNTIYATNTSSISITAIGSALKFPDRLAGWHFFNPAPLMALVEVVKGLSTSEAVAKQLYDTAIFCGKTPVYAKSTPGFIVNRVARPFYTEAMRVLNETKESFAVVDRVMRESGGFRMGPFELMDLIGNDVNYAVTESVWSAYYYDERFSPSLLQKEYVDAGYYGRKVSRGFYEYDEAQQIIPRDDLSERLMRMEGGVSSFSITLNTQSDFYEVWEQILEGNGVKVHKKALADQDVLLILDDIACYITTGVTAAEQAFYTKNESVVMLDLAIDYQSVTTLAVSRSPMCSDQNLEKFVQLFTYLGKAVIELEDTPGLLVMRTIAMLANEAADVVNQNVSAVKDVDIAMRLGVGYPKGPLKWADEIGISYVVTVLKNLHRVYGDARYRLSPKLQQKLYLGEFFYD